MKRMLIPVISAVVIGFVLAKLVFNQYETEQITTVFNEREEINLIQVGVYSNKDIMEENTKNFNYYVYSIEDNLYHVYVGITLDDNNLKKLENYYKKLGYDVYVKKVKVDNREFIDVLKQYDKLLKRIHDDESLKDVNEKVLQKYKELVLWLRWKKYL